MFHRRLFPAIAVLALPLLFLCFPVTPAVAGGASKTYAVLAPISHDKLTIFPVVAQVTHDTSNFITLDEGIRSGEVVVTEAGAIRPLVRGPHTGHFLPNSGGEVNKLVLVNNSKHPLILLAGEIVTGGKQDRIIAKDRIIPAGGDPVDLSVFCVEPGRWTSTSAKFGAMPVPQMAQPSLRFDAMAKKDQQEVWNEVSRSSQRAAAVAGVMGSGGAIGVPGPPPLNTTSYAKTMQNQQIEKTVDSVAKPIESSYGSIMRQLRDQHAVGVVVAVNGEIIWADIFASTQLLEKYWPKLVRSYAAEAITTDLSQKKPTISAAEDFLRQFTGNHETIETDPGVYRESETVGENYRLFTLFSLLPGTDYDLHISKMAEETAMGKLRITPSGQMPRD